MSGYFTQYLCECDRCGQRCSPAELREEWTGYRVCHDCYDHKHPQLDLRAKSDQVVECVERPTHFCDPCRPWGSVHPAVVVGYGVPYQTNYLPFHGHAYHQGYAYRHYGHSHCHCHPKHHQHCSDCSCEPEHCCPKSPEQNWWHK